MSIYCILNKAVCTYIYIYVCMYIGIFLVLSLKESR